MAKLKITADQARKGLPKDEARVQKILDTLTSQIRQKVIEGETRMVVDAVKLGYSGGFGGFRYVLDAISEAGFLVGSYDEMSAEGPIKKVFIDWKEPK